MPKINKQSLFLYLISVIPLLIIGKIFLPWFVLPQINAGDWPYYAKGMFDDFTIIAPLWSGQNGVGLGGVNPNFPLFTYQYFTIGFFVNLLHIPWVIVYKTTWYGLSLVLGVSSVIFLYKSIRSTPSFWELTISIFLYISNSYFLMITSGGQLGVVLAYTVAPFALAFAIRSTKVFTEHIKIISLLRNGFFLALFFALEVFFDSRLSYLTFGVIILYFIYYYFFVQRFNLIAFLKHLTIWVASVFILHSFWIIPFSLFKLLQLPYVITSSDIFSFFSFADFSHAFAFLHPNWPDNIFGKIYFLQPEFLIYPIIAFSGLLFLKKGEKNNANYLFFALLSIVGVFMAKGVNDPFGSVNAWLFNHVPGFNLFRDPTKYYLFISLSYSILIPLALVQIIEKFIKRKILITTFILVVIVLITFPIRNAFLGSLNGTMKNTPIPQEYVDLATFLYNQNDFFRTLWVPTTSRFRFASEPHTVLSASDLFNTSSTSAIVKHINQEDTKNYLERINVKYIIIPYDSTSEIFLTERKYDDSKRQEVERQIDQIGWLKKIVLGRITLYEMPKLIDQFSIDSLSVRNLKKSGSEYQVFIDIPQQKTLLFSESFHPGWSAFENGKEIMSIKTEDGLNSFFLPAGKYTLTVEFLPDTYQKYFYLISVIYFSGILIFLYSTRNKNK